MSEDAEVTEFAQRVLEVVGQLGPGEIVTYGEVAAEIGQPGAARAVGTTLRKYGSEVPWWRVVAASGRLVPGSERRHARHLKAEGVAVRDDRVVMSGVD